jgi:thymidylate synthase
MNNLDKQYTDLLQDILDNGVRKEDRTGTGTISVFGRQIRHKMSDGFPLLTTKKMAWKTMVTELIWFLRGDTNIKFLVDNNCHIWNGDAYKNWFENGRTEFDQFADPMFMSDDALGKEKFHEISMKWFIDKIKTDDEFAKKWGELGPVYGAGWRNWGGKKEKYQQQRSYGGSFGGPTHVEYGELVEYDVPGIDQIQNLITDLKTNPDSRRLMVSAWNVGELDSMVLPPCHYGFQVYTRELSLEERVKYYETTLGRLHFVPPTIDLLNKENIPTRAISLMWNQRSCDFPLGIPMNISSYALLLTIIAKEVNMVPNELIGNLGDCHIYINQIEGVKEQISREPYPLPTLILDDWYSTQGDPSNTSQDISEFLKDINVAHIRIEKYQSHPKIYFPLSN